MNLDDIKSNKVRYCLYCGIPITPDTDSGWEGFTSDGKTTQPICAWCDVVQANEIGIKAEEDDKDKT
jgi:hypothetical protein